LQEFLDLKYGIVRAGRETSLGEELGVEESKL